jgi:hypothetical protein
MSNLINPNPSILDSELKLYRYWNFRGLIDSTSNSVVADMLGKQTSYISAISGPNPSRAIGDALAAKIESAFRLSPGDMDAKPDRRSSHDDPLIAEVARMMMVANSLDKELITSIVKQLCGHSITVIDRLQKADGKIPVITAENIMNRIPSSGIDISPSTGDNAGLI